jgi:hypothetical protein
MKKNLTLIVILIAGLLPGLAWAAGRVPDLPPLQPTAGAGLDYSAPLNSPNGNVAKQALEQAQSQAAPIPTIKPTSPGATPAASPSDQSVPPVAPTVWTYWLMIVAGIVGLLLIGVWIYFRFVKNRNRS